MFVNGTCAGFVYLDGEVPTVCLYCFVLQTGLVGLSAIVYATVGCGGSESINAELFASRENLLFIPPPTHTP